MGTFSKDPQDVLTDALAKDYTSVLVEQGVPVLDRDLNLLADLSHHWIKKICRRYLGNSVAANSDGFRINKLQNNDFSINAGTILVNGLFVTLPKYDEDTTYRNQPLTENLLPNLPSNKEYYVYVHVWEEKWDDDPDLGNDEDVGMQTSIRRKVLWQVVASIDAINDNKYMHLATIDPTVDPPQIEDVRRKSLLANVFAKADGRVGIGTKNPQTKLDVSGNILISSPDDDIYGIQLARTDEEGHRHTWKFWHMNESYRKNSLEIWEYKTGNDGKQCKSTDPAAMCNPRVVITEGGNVGIGTKEPMHKLHVNSDDRAAILTISSKGIDADDGAVVSNYAALNLLDMTNNRWWHITHRTQQNRLQFSFWNNQQYNNLMTIVPSMDEAGHVIGGNVGIGIYPSKTLDVNGSTWIRGKLGTQEYDPDDGYPQGWGGGIHTFDVYAEGSIACGREGAINAVIGNDGIADFKKVMHNGKPVVGYLDDGTPVFARKLTGTTGTLSQNESEISIDHDITNATTNILSVVPIFLPWDGELYTIIKCDWIDILDLSWNYEHIKLKINCGVPTPVIITVFYTKLMEI